MHDLIEIAKPFGAAGLIAVALAWWIHRQDKHHRAEAKEQRELGGQERSGILRAHKEERKEWNETNHNLTQAVLDVTKENTGVIGELTLEIRKRNGYKEN